MSRQSALKSLAAWTVPPALQDLARSFWHGSRLDAAARAILSQNQTLCDRHSGQRCFILGTGPSINRQDLRPLRNELCISLNLFYLHPDMSWISPRYHLTTGLAPHPNISIEQGNQWFRQIDEKLGDSVLLLNYLDRRFVDERGFFRSRQVHYLHSGARWENLPRSGITATRLLYPYQCVSVLAIQVALYMGFRRVYLVGLDHDWLLRLAQRSSTHFYRPQDSALERAGLDEWRGVDWSGTLASYAVLWDQYARLKDFAVKRGVQILNATAGGLLDVFERVEYPSVVASEPVG